MSDLRIVFAGTPDFAVPALQALMDSQHSVVAVYTQPDRPSGRGRKLTASPVKQLANQAAIEVRQPFSLKAPEQADLLINTRADLMVVAAYGLLLPQSILDIPRLGCWNIHGSLLPRWRGAAPIQRAILAGDDETGICMMQMEKGLDTGPVLSRRKLPIGASETAGELHDRLADLGAALLVDTLAHRHTLVREVQNDKLATYADKLVKSEAEMDWTKSAGRLSREIRAFNPWPVSRCVLGADTLRVWAAAPVAEAKNPGADPGEIVQAGTDGLDVACGQGVLRLLRVQRAGGRPVDISDFLNARPLAPGDCFTLVQTI